MPGLGTPRVLLAAATLFLAIIAGCAAADGRVDPAANQKQLDAGRATPGTAVVAAITALPSPVGAPRPTPPPVDDPGPTASPALARAQLSPVLAGSAATPTRVYGCASSSCPSAIEYAVNGCT